MRIYLAFTIFIFFNNSLHSQSLEIEFLHSLQAAKTNFSYIFDKPVPYKFDSCFSITADINLNLIFNSPNANKVEISNKTFKNFKNVVFIINKSTELNLHECQFIDCGTVFFHFGEKEQLYNSSKTSITIEKCKFLNYNAISNKADNFYQLYFKRIPGLKNKYCSISNAKIDNCYFLQEDSSNSFLTKDNLLPSRYSLLFYREDENVSINNILLSENKFELFIPNYRAFGIVFFNDHQSNFKEVNIPLEKYFDENHSIIIRNNNLTTTSADPGHGIFIEGPSRDVSVISNIVNSFGANLLNQDNQLQRDGAIHLYGGRTGTSYSNDFVNVDVSHNTVNSVSTGIRLSGFNEASVNYNKIKLFPDAGFYSDPGVMKRLQLKQDPSGINCRTGNYTDSSRQSNNLAVENNTIDCSGSEGCIGIGLDVVKNFIVRSNKIIKPNDFGILYYSNNGFVEQNMGTSIIQSNTIDFGDQKLSDLKSGWYSRYSVPFGGIIIARTFNTNQKNIENESLTISDNEIVINNNLNIQPISIIQDKELDKYVKDENFRIFNNKFEK